MKELIKVLLVIIGIVVFLIAGLKLFYIVRENIFKNQELQSLKTQGGGEITLQVEMKDIPPDQRDQVLKDTTDIIFKRIKLLGFYPFIKTTSDYKIIVQVAHGGDLDMLADLIGKTAQFSIWEENLHSATPSSLPRGITEILLHPTKTDLIGYDLEKATVILDSDRKPQVQLKFKSAGAKKLADITKRNVGKTIAIVLDDEIIQRPRVIEPIYEGVAVISGKFTIIQAKELQIQLNAGVMPAPISVVDKQYVKH